MDCTCYLSCWAILRSLLPLEPFLTGLTRELLAQFPSLTVAPEPYRADKKHKKQKVDRKGGLSNAGLDLEEDSSDDERDKKTAL